MTPFWQSPNGDVTIYCGDARDVLPQLPAACVHMAVTSPPYFGLRSYADKRALGNEPTPAEYLAHQVDLFRAVRHVLRPDGTLWANIGDSFSHGKGKDATCCVTGGKRNSNTQSTLRCAGRKKGERLGIPWQLALALQRDGWRLRQENIWFKKSPMPESVSGTSWRRCRVKTTGGARGIEKQRNGASVDRPQQDHDGRDFAPSALWRDCTGCPKCSATGGYVRRWGSGRSTTAHEPVFMFSAGKRYFYDTEAAREGKAMRSAGDLRSNADGQRRNRDYTGSASNGGTLLGGNSGGRNMRSVWHIGSEPSNYDFCNACGLLYVGTERDSIRRAGTTSTCPNCGRTDAWVAHFAAFPRALPERCIRAGTAPKCCAQCGMPYAPVVDVGYITDRAAGEWCERLQHIDGMSRSADFSAQGKARVANTVSGYRPLCDCDAGVAQPPSLARDSAPLVAAAPAVVLDPYGGTGQTAIAALALGRRCILCEISADYCALARARVERALKIAPPVVNAAPASLGPLFAGVAP